MLNALVSTVSTEELTDVVGIYGHHKSLETQEKMAEICSSRI